MNVNKFVINRGGVNIGNLGLAEKCHLKNGIGNAFREIKDYILRGKHEVLLVAVLKYSTLSKRSISKFYHHEIQLKLFKHCSKVYFH